MRQSKIRSVFYVTFCLSFVLTFASCGAKQPPATNTPTDSKTATVPLAAPPSSRTPPKGEEKSAAEKAYWEGVNKDVKAIKERESATPDGSPFPTGKPAVASDDAGSGDENYPDPEDALVGKNQPAPQVPPTDAKGRLTFKGLSLGMNIDDALKIFNKYNPTKADSFVKEKANDMLVIHHKSDAPSLAREATGLSRVIANQQGEIVYIQLQLALLTEMFSANDMTATEFAKQFVASYKIPNMTLEQKEGGWVYMRYSDFNEGYKLQISGIETIKGFITLTLEKTQRKFD